MNITRKIAGALLALGVLAGCGKSDTTEPDADDETTTTTEASTEEALPAECDRLLRMADMARDADNDEHANQLAGQALTDCETLDNWNAGLELYAKAAGESKPTVATKRLCTYEHRNAPVCAEAIDSDLFPTPRSTTTTSTTTTAPPSPEQLRQVSVDQMISTFDSQRDDLADVLGDLTDIETVDRLVFEGDTVIIEVTSAWASPDNQHDGAWAIMKGMASFWDPEEGAWFWDNFVPTFQFVNSGRSYTCSGEFMVEMVTLTAGREQWEATCS